MKDSFIDIFREHGGQLRMSEAIAHGMTRHMLYTLRDKGIIELVSRGVYRLTELPNDQFTCRVETSFKSLRNCSCKVGITKYKSLANSEAERRQVQLIVGGR